MAIPAYKGSVLLLLALLIPYRPTMHRMTKTQRRDGLWSTNDSTYGLTATSNLESVLDWTFAVWVFFMIDSGEFGSLYAAEDPPFGVTIGIFGSTTGVGGRVDIYY